MAELRGKELDSLVEAVLREEEPLRPVPLLLHRRVTSGIRIAVWRRQEQARFRRLLAWSAFAAAGVLCAAIMAVILTHLAPLIRPGVAGGMGWYDYYSTSLSVAWHSYSGAYTLLASFALAAGAILIALIPLGLSQKGHRKA